MTLNTTESNGPVNAEVVHVEVIPPGSLDATRLEFRLDLAVSAAAAKAASELGYHASAAGFQNDRQEQLQGTLTLAEAGVNDNYVLYLIDTAGGQ